MVSSLLMRQHLIKLRFNLSKLEPVVDKPHSPDNRAIARECKDVKIDRVYIGSCTGGKTKDSMAAISSTCFYV
ncbi:hypothetical protein YC2023_077582 [Brassica napus]